MKKSQSRTSTLKEKVFIALMVFEVLSLALTAQDAAVLEMTPSKSPVLMYQEMDFSATLINEGEITLYDGLVVFQVLKEEDIIFEYHHPIFELTPEQPKVFNSFPQTWTPSIPGDYIIRTETYFHFDKNLTNNIMETPLEVISVPDSFNPDQENSNAEEAYLVSFNKKDQNLLEVKILNNPGSIFDPVKIKFELPVSRFVDVKIFDLRGKKVFEKRLGYLFEGNYEYELVADGLSGVGNYVLVLFAEDRTSTMIFVRM